MIKKIKQRVKAWKRLYAEGCAEVDENSSWREILAEQEYYSADKFDTSAHSKWRTAIKTIGTFSEEEQRFLETLPVYEKVKLFMMFDEYHEEFSGKIEGVEVYCMCLAQTEDISIREYTIITDNEDLWNLEIYVLKFARYPDLRQHVVIRFAKEPPADFFMSKSDLPL